MTAVRAAPQAMKTNKPDEIPEDIYVGFVRSSVHGRRAFCCLARCAGPGRPARLLEDQGTDLFRPRRPDDGRQPWPLSGHPQGRSGKHRRLRDRAPLGALLHRRGHDPGLLRRAFRLRRLYVAPDTFGEIAAISMLLASTITIAGRNFGSRKMVAILSVSVLAPITLGLMLKGDFYHVMLGLFVIPFMFSINKMAHLVRTVLFTAISEEKKANRIAERFNRALNTMSHGLVMLGPNGRVVVANAEAAHLMSFKSPDALLGRSIHSMLMRGVAGGHARPQGLQVHRGTTDARTSRGPGPQGPRFAFERPAFRVFGQRGQSGARRHHLRGRDAARRGGGEDPLHGAFRQSDRPAEPRLFPRAGRRNHVDRRPRPLLRACRARSRRLQERQRHAGTPCRRRADLRRGGAACGLRQRHGQGQPLRRRRIHDLHRPRRRRKPSGRHPRPHIRRAAGRDRCRRPRAAHPGERRRGAVARQGHRCRRHDRQGRPCPLQGQGARQERLAAVRGGDGCRLPQPPADEGRPARRDRDQVAARRLPADRDDGHDAHRQLRGALPLGTPRPRPDLAGGLHSACRGNGHDLRDQPFRSSGSLRRMRPLAGPDQRLREPVGQGFPQSRRHREGAQRARDLGAGARIGSRSR